jgi:hypothetical protein
MLAIGLHTRLSILEKQHHFDGDCQVVTSTDALPISIKNAFAKSLKMSRLLLPILELDSIQQDC